MMVLRVDFGSFMAGYLVGPDCVTVSAGATDNCNVMFPHTRRRGNSKPLINTTIHQTRRRPAVALQAAGKAEKSSTTAQIGSQTYYYTTGKLESKPGVVVWWCGGVVVWWCGGAVIAGWLLSHLTGL